MDDKKNQKKTGKGKAQAQPDAQAKGKKNEKQLKDKFFKGKKTGKKQ